MMHEARTDLYASNIRVRLHRFCSRSSCRMRFKRQIRASRWWEAGCGIFTSGSTSVRLAKIIKMDSGKDYRQFLPAPQPPPPSSFFTALSPSGRHFVKYLSSVLFFVHKHLIAHLMALHRECLRLLGDLCLQTFSWMWPCKKKNPQQSLYTPEGVCTVIPIPLRCK